MLALAYVLLVPYSALQSNNIVPNTLPRCQMPESILTVKLVYILVYLCL